ncbi:glutamine-hydrolyzing GMP synthase [Bathymodiolus septemdierum thioautotrophic gill symbiont]|uniref:GMP synthase [glutamine-hydrolyzing] n=1 Tax=endosymbiont of Bathymodiolus septemdierum str. Myojin knoll TaxID=1303921 RepID=A0A0P0USV9_9GAMM|nr:glutamine-hydrolyzing GMP synthase [Bathymodiolus septemdierum thioautotrophic gill symbiont]BAS68273.1 GMP synthase (glutamine-hydrolysing) [endosymbiont of Bathymodiolus septemdierum str. Myojin knoll]
MENIHKDKILILDFGSQYTQLIARRVREIGVYCELLPYDVDENFIKRFNPKGIILSGGPDTVTLDDSARAPQIVFDLGVPILGICYGMQTMATQLGGLAVSADKHEYGFAKVRARNHSSLLNNIMDEVNDEGHGLLDVWMSHGIEVKELPKGFKLIASTDNCAIAGFANVEKHYYGLQFHPEVTHTKQGVHILERFVSGICDCEKNWTTDNIITDLIQALKNQIGDGNVLLGLSGGVDSSVVAVLLHQAIGNQLTCVFVDNGLLRLNEGDEVMKTFAENMGVKVIRADAQEKFYNALSNENEPEAKRKIIGRTFVEVFEEEAKHLDNIKFLAQGTIYPDVIESAGAASGKAKVIKSHHNVGGLPDDLAFELVEPLKELFKDEVRTIGVKLGIPAHMLYRHPFPGPGLGVRILGQVKQEYANILREADAIFMDELYKNDLYDKVNQAFAVFLPIKSVGVTGDERRYDYVIALRAVETIDFMTARWAHLPYDFLDTVSNRIMNEISRVSRVVYDISGKPPATIEWE